MITLHGERMAQRLTTGAPSDMVLTAFDLPADSVLHGFSCRVQMIATEVKELVEAVGYAVAVAVVELDDPDTGDSYDDLLDRYMPKYTDVDTIDLDTGAANATPFWEPGEASFEEVFDMDRQVQVIYRRKKLLTLADPGNAGFRFQPSETPFAVQWLPADTFTIRVNRRIRARRPSVVLVAVASPAFDDTTVTLPAHLLENEWGQIQYAESTLERALMDQLNVVEAGAETPWVEASLVLRKHLAPDVFEQTAARFLLQNWNIYSYLHFSHSVPGQMSFKSVDLTP